MDAFLPFIVAHAHMAHYVIFALFLLAGISFPISEDLLIIISGILASTIVPENMWKLFAAVFFGAYLSDLLVYWIGRKWGVRLWRMKFIARMVKPERLEQVQSYYRRYGISTLFVGRFIPFGVRNCLFAAAGMAKMSFAKFLFYDGFACLISNTTLFLLSYLCGKNHDTMWKHMKWANAIIFSLFVIALIIFIWYKKSRTKSIGEEAD